MNYKVVKMKNLKAFSDEVIEIAFRMAKQNHDQNMIKGDKRYGVVSADDRFIFNNGSWLSMWQEGIFK